jgi:hypothetical protein
VEGVPAAFAWGPGGFDVVVGLIVVVMRVVTSAVISVLGAVVVVFAWFWPAVIFLTTTVVVVNGSSTAKTLPSALVTESHTCLGLTCASRAMGGYIVYSLLCLRRTVPFNL